MRRLEFRHRIGLLVTVAALALITVTAVTLILGRRNAEQISGIETRYLPLIELDRDLKSIFAQIPRALEDAATAADEAKLQEADTLEADLIRRLHAGAATIIDNGGDPGALETDLRAYYTIARDVSTSLAAGTEATQLVSKIERMRETQRTFASHLDLATSPDRRRLAAAFSTARATQRTSLQIDILVASIALLAMTVLSLRISRRTVRSLRAVADGVERLARGEFGQEIEVTSDDELGDLAREANRTAVRLREYREQADREDWIKTGLGELAERIAGELDPDRLADKAMQYLADYVGARDAAVRAAEERSTTDDPGTRVVVRPRDDAQVILVPLVHAGRVLRVLELVVSDPPPDRTLDLLSRTRGTIGVALRVAESHQHAHELLLETQRQASAAQTANKELEAFSYSVSHDLRAPLRAIDGFSQALVEDCADTLPVQGQDHLRRIRAAAQRMAELIDDLLRLSRVSRAEFRRERVDLSAMFISVIGELRRSDPDRIVDVRVASSITAFADPRLIRITLENLVGNAWKFTAKTAAPVIELGVRSEGGERVYFVRDNGAGFDMKYVDRLFGAFQRLHTDKEFPGTGIGLATVQRIIHRHGGRIWVDAAVGEGACFQFTLPDDTSGGAQT